MEKAISEIIGRGDLSEGGATQVYRALRPLLCSTCAAEIAVDALFTRRKVKGIGLNIMPQCQKCAPFTLRPGKKEKSDLLQALLRGQATETKQVAPQSSALPDKEFSKPEGKSLDEAVKRRLGPALKRSRRVRK